MKAVSPCGRVQEGRAVQIIREWTAPLLMASSI